MSRPKNGSTGVTMNRRHLLKNLSLYAAASTVLAGCKGKSEEARRPFNTPADPIPHPVAPGVDPLKKPRFLIVVGASGGASIIDSFMAVRNSESPNPLTVNTFVDNEVITIPGSPLRAVDLTRTAIGSIPVPAGFTTSQSTFVNKLKDDMMVVTATTTSVNHVIGQKRAINGNGAWNGRTLQEAVAVEYGAGYPIPNVNMATFGYLEHGTDPTVPSWALNEPIATPFLWPLGLDGSRGLNDLPSRDLIAKAREMRNGKLDPQSGFDRTFGASEKIGRWKESRQTQAALEAADAITNLNFLPDIPTIPLSEFGLAESPDAAMVRAAFPAFASDPLESQCALAYLLIKNRISVTVTISPGFNLSTGGGALANLNLPIAFDFAHQAHRAGQAVMWNRILTMIDRLVTLLKADEFDATTGESFWDRTMIFVATDFGRSKRRVGGADVFGTSHDLNNGFLVVSPLANGNKVIGGVDPATMLTYGANIQTGAPDPGRNNTEAEVFAGVLQALKVDTSGSGLPDVPAMRRPT